MSFSQPIALCVNELIFRVTSDLAGKVAGPDPDLLKRARIHFSCCISWGKVYSSRRCIRVVLWE